METITLSTIQTFNNAHVQRESDRERARAKEREKERAGREGESLV